MLQFEVDREFRGIVAHALDAPPLTMRQLRLVAMAAAAAMVVGGLSLPDAHPGVLFAWWALALPGFVLAAMHGAERMAKAARPRR